MAANFINNQYLPRSTSYEYPQHIFFFMENKKTYPKIITNYSSLFPLTWFVCIEVLQPSQHIGVMSSIVSLPNHTFTGQTLSSKRWTKIVHILLPETDKCPSWISRRERMTIENILWSISTKECCRPSRGRTHNILITRRTCIQLSHHGQPLWHGEYK